MIKFREHRGSLADSMETVREFEDRNALVKWLIEDLDRWYITITEKDIKAARYHYDDRIGWDNYIVLINGYGVIGFTDGPSGLEKL